MPSLLHKGTQTLRIWIWWKIPLKVLVVLGISLLYSPFNCSHERLFVLQANKPGFYTWYTIFFCNKRIACVMLQIYTYKSAYIRLFYGTTHIPINLTTLTTLTTKEPANPTNLTTLLISITLIFLTTLMSQVLDCLPRLRAWCSGTHKQKLVEVLDERYFNIILNKLNRCY